MIKRLVLLAVIICFVILPGCNKSEIKEIDSLGKDEHTPIPPPSLNPQEEIKEYLVGEWIFDKNHISDVICKMDIDKELNINLAFNNTYTHEYNDAWQGEITFDRQYAEIDEKPDLISIELSDDSWPGGDYFFLHRTIYNGKSVMSLFPAANGNGIFDMLGDLDNFEYGPDEIIFEKESGKVSHLPLRKDEEFHAVFWGKGDQEEEFWLDDVLWTPIEDYDPDQKYPDGMIIYENHVKESLLYSLLEVKAKDILLGQNFFFFFFYFVKTDENGKIIEIENAEHKEYIDTINDPDS